MRYVEMFPGAARLSSDRAAMLQSGSPPFLAAASPYPVFQLDQRTLDLIDTFS